MFPDCSPINFSWSWPVHSCLYTPLKAMEVIQLSVISEPSENVRLAITNRPIVAIIRKWSMCITQKCRCKNSLIKTQTYLSHIWATHNSRRFPIQFIYSSVLSHYRPRLFMTTLTQATTGPHPEQLQSNPSLHILFLWISLKWLCIFGTEKLYLSLHDSRI